MIEARETPSAKLTPTQSPSKALAADKPTALERLPSLLPAIDAGLAADTRDAAATRVATELAVQLDALRVSIVWQERANTAAALQVIGLSHQIRVELGQQQEKLLLAAAAESIDQQSGAYTAQSSHGITSSPNVIIAAHRQLLNGPCGLSMSVLLTNAIQQGQQQWPAQVHGSLLIELPTGHALIDKPQLLEQALTQVASPLCRLLLLAQRAQRKRDRWFNRFGTPGRTRLTGFACAAILLMALLVPVANPVSAPARLEGQVQRQVAAPVAGILKSVHVRPGDEVKAGQLIAQLQELDFELESNRLQSEAAQHESAMRSAMAKGDRSALMQAQAKLEEVAAQTAQVKTQLASIQLRAPIDGVVISGDLQPLIGNPIDRGQMLAQVAPSAKFRVVVEIDERDLRRIKNQQQGELTLSALPFATLLLQVDRVGPAAVQIEQRRALEVYANLSGDAAKQASLQLRPGLRGVAHLDAGYRPLLLIWGTRLAEYGQLFAWRWFPWLT
jgi:biotin carboxyl carrier protein